VTVESLAGQLVISGGGLFDPNFRHTVVLVAEHTEDGAMGLVLNRPTPVLVVDAVPALRSVAFPDDRVFVGGPVQAQSAVILAEFEHPDFAARVITGAIGFPEGEVGPEGLRGVRRTRVFAGYAGWGPGQLESEIAESSWILEPAQGDDIFSAEPERLWSTTLRRKGRDYALLSLMPFDPSSN
jgi:putative transcriptional regulator